MSLRVHLFGPTLFLVSNINLYLNFNNLTAAQQHFSLRNDRTFKGTGQLNRHTLIWKSVLRPTPLSREYKIKVVYKQGGVPQVYVLDPDIKLLAEDRSIPHVYCQKPTRLCLYHPSGNEWSASMKISESIIPWAVLWFFHFEYWLISNEWKGGGRHPNE